jgi:hypothetical protein
MPTVKWHWNETRKDAVVEDLADNPDVQKKALLYFANTLEIGFCGEGNINKLYDIGVTTIPKLLALDEKTLVESGGGFGKSGAKKLVDAIAEAKDIKSNVNHLRNLGSNKLSGLSGALKGALGYGAAAEYDTLASTLLKPSIKVFNPSGQVSQGKLFWMRDTLLPKASESQATQNFKLNTVERIADQAEKQYAAKTPMPLDVLTRTMTLTIDEDMPSNGDDGNVWFKLKRK